MEKGEKIWIDGKLIDWADAKVHIMTHALNYGTGVFEGIRVYQTPRGPAVFRLREHVARLFNGCKVMGIESVFGGRQYSVQEVMDAVIAAIKANSKVDYIKPCVFLSGEAVGLNPVGLPASLAITCIYMGSYLGEDSKSGAKLITSSWQRPDNLCGPAGAKVNGTYITSCLAKQEAVRQGANEAVMLNSAGHVAECTGENIFILRKGKIFTPQTSECILEGITRDSVVQIARDLGYEVAETEMTRMQLLTADEVWMTGTAAEVVPVTMIDNRIIGSGKVGKVAEEIHRKFHDIASGNEPKYESWLHYVK